MALDRSIVASIEELQARTTAGYAVETPTVVTGGSAGAVGYTWTRTVRTDGGAGAIVTLTGSVTVTGDGANIELNFPSPVSEGYNSCGTVTGDGTLQVLGGGVDVSSSGVVTLEATPAATATGWLSFSLSFIEGVTT